MTEEGGIACLDHCTRVLLRPADRAKYEDRPGKVLILFTALAPFFLSLLRSIRNISSFPMALF